MPARIEDSVDPRPLAVWGRWFAFALAGLLVACLCAFLFFGPEAQAKDGKASHHDAPTKSQPAPSDPSDNGKPGKSDPAPPKSDPPPSPPNSDTPRTGDPSPPPTSDTPHPPTSDDPPPASETPPPPPPASETPPPPLPASETPPPPPPASETPPPVSSDSPPIGQPVAAFQNLVARLLEVVDGLLGGGSEAPNPTDAPSTAAVLQSLATNLSDQVSALAAKLLQLVDGLLGGGSEAPNPTDAPSTAAVLQSLANTLLHLADEWLNSYFGQIDYLFSGQFYLPLSSDGFTMPYDSGGKGDAPIPDQAPPVPSGPPPASTFLSGSGFFSSNGASALLLVGVLASLLILVLSGKFLWSSRDFLKPNSVLQLALERPG